MVCSLYTDFLVAGDTVEMYTFQNQSGGSAVNLLAANFSASYIQESENVVIPAQTNLTEFTDYTPVTQGIGSPTITFAKWRQVGDSYEVQIKLNTEEFTMSISNLTLQGKHNVKNAMAAAMASQLLKVRKQTIKEAVDGMKKVLEASPLGQEVKHYDTKKLIDLIEFYIVRKVKDVQITRIQTKEYVVKLSALLAALQKATPGRKKDIVEEMTVLNELDSRFN